MIRSYLTGAVTAVVLCAWFALATPGTALAVNLEWNQASGSFPYNTAANWTPNQVPTAVDNVTFDLNATYIVTLDAISFGLDVNLLDGDVTFRSVGASDTLNTGGVGTIDDAGATSLANGAKLTLDGSTLTAWNNAQNVTVGDAGFGTLSVSSEASFFSDSLFIGDGPGSEGVVNVDGSDSTMSITNTGATSGILIGNEGAGTLNVTDEGFAGSNAEDIVLGSAATGEGTLNITGSNSRVTGGDFTAGGGGTGHVMVSGEGRLQTSNAIVGLDAGSNGDVTVTDDQSVMNASNLTVGDSGAGTVGVEAGGRINVGPGGSNNVTIGQSDTGDGSITVTGSGTNASILDVDNAVFVGNVGKGKLTVSDGGRVNVGNDLFIANAADGSVARGLDDNKVTVTGAGSILGVADELRIGNQAKGSLEVLDGALVTVTGSAALGSGANTEGTVSVTGAGSILQVDGNRISVGGLGKGTLNVQDGGQVTANQLVIADDDAIGSVSEVTIDGMGSRIDLVAGTAIGQQAPGSLTIQNGGLLKSGIDGTSLAIIGSNAASDGSSVTVDGKGSTWDHSGTTSRISVGHNSETFTGIFPMLTVTNGGKVLAHDFVITDETFGLGRVIVDGTDEMGTPSTISFDGDAAIGDQEEGRLTVSGGGRFIATDGAIDLGSSFGGIGVVTVKDEGSLLSAATTLMLGGAGNTSGNLNIIDGGTVTSLDGQVGVDTPGSSGTVNVGNGSAAISSWTISDSLSVISSIGFNVNAGGLIEVGNTLTIHNANTVTLNGGTMVLDTIAFVGPFAGFDFNSGALRFTTSPGVTLNATLFDRLFDTSSPTLIAGQELAVDNTATLSAPLRLNGGTFSVGTIDLAGIANLEFNAGTFNLTQDDLTIGNTGIFGPTVILDLGKTINVTNQVTIETGAELAVFGGFSSGGLTNNGDLILADTTGSGKTINGALTTPGGSTVTVIGTINFADLVSGAGQFFGPGTANFLGGHNPGDSTAAVEFEGNVILPQSSTLFIELEGTTPGDDHDQLDIAQSVTLGGGELDITLLNGYVPDYLDEFVVITAGTRDGEFGDVTGAFINPDMTLAPVYDHDGNTGLTLFATIPATRT